MYLLFEPTNDSVRYTTFDKDASVIYEGAYAVKDWHPRTVATTFDRDLLPKLRAHGKLFTKIGIIVPFADSRHSEPAQASVKLIQHWSTSAMRKQALQPVLAILQASQKSWPHLPHWFLFDTHLSHHLSRDKVLPPFDYEMSNTLGIHPMVLHSYGHKANLAKVKNKGWTISLYLGSQASVALFEDNDIRDAVVTYSAQSALPGLRNGGLFDSGFFLDVAEKRNYAKLSQLLLGQTGLQPMTDTKYDFSTLLQIAGLTPRDKNFQVDDYSIETIEWVELSLMSYIRALRHAIGAMKAYDSDIKTLVVNSSVIGEEARFWTVLLKPGLSDLKLVMATMSPLEAACRDLISREMR